MDAKDFDWLTGREAVLHRPDAYVGPNDPEEATGLLRQPDDSFQTAAWCLSPIFLKIFDEVVVNAMDAATRDETQRYIHVTWCGGNITVENDGAGIPVKLFKDTQRYIPSVIFSELSAGSNFDDDRERFVGGRNGVGVSCCNIWSKNFRVDVSDATASFSQAFSDNMSVSEEPKITEKPGRHGYVRVVYHPDYERMGIDAAASASLLSSLLLTRTAEVAVCVRPGTAVTFNGAKLSAKPLDLAKQLFGGSETCCVELGRAQTGAGGQLVLCRRAEEGACSEDVGFVNGVRCGNGTHMAYLRDKIYKAVVELAKKRRCEAHIRPQTVREVVAMVAVVRVANPHFSSQSKDTLTTPSRSFGWSLDVTPAFLVKFGRLGVVDEIVRREADRELASSLKKTAPRSRDILIDKYDPALDCRKDPGSCTLILCEGDSAKALCVAGLSVIGRSKYGVFPLKGVPLNVRNCSSVKKILENAEASALLKILNIQPGASSFETLRYARLAVMSDQDLDGSHICGLILNFILHLFPKLLDEHPDFLQRIVTPLIRVTQRRSGLVTSFYSMREFDEWKEGQNLSAYSIKYLKGLGTNSTAEAKEIFRNLEQNIVRFTRTEDTEDTLRTFFDESLVAKRKELLEQYSPDAAPEYGEGRTLTIDRFLLSDLIHFSMHSVHRAISAVDGLTPSRRKVLFYFLAQKPNAEIKVAQAAAGVAQMTMYLHGEVSLQETIVSMAQGHVGTNNVPLLEGLGQFGSRLHKPSTHAAPRYIFSRASALARVLFPAADEPVLRYREEEGVRVEPEIYANAVLPLVLINGCSGIGTGYSTRVPCFGLVSVAACCRALMKEGVDAELPALEPYYEGFEGSLEVTDRGVITRGAFERVDDHTIVVTELPVGRWTEPFLTDVRAMADAKRKPGQPAVADVLNESTDTAAKIRITFVDSIADRTDQDLMVTLKLCTAQHATFMYLFDSGYRLRLFAAYHDIVREHARMRLDLYEKRKAHLLAELQRRIDLLNNRRRFVALLVSGELRVLGVRRSDLEARLLELGLGDVEHLLAMSLAACTLESMERLDAEANQARERLEVVSRQTAVDMWELDLLEVEKGYAAYQDAMRSVRESDRRESEEKSGVDASGGKARKRRATPKAPVKRPRA